MLEAIGLSSTESCVYTALVDNPRATASQIAEQCRISTGLAARTLAGLARRGMASRLPGRRARYVAVAPDAAVQPLLTRREAELLQVRGAVHELMTAYQQAARRTHPAELVEVVTGAGNIVSRALALQDSAREQIRALDKPPYLMPPGGNDDQVRRLREGIEYRVVYEQWMLSTPKGFRHLRGLSQQGEKARTLPELPLKVWIADDSAAIIPIRTSNPPSDAAFVVYPSALLDALVALFELEWQRAVPIRVHQPGGDQPDGGPDEDIRTLLLLLAAGLTDEGIARATGLSLRTLQRRIQAIMRELGVTTRFQAGLAAKERGWL